MDPQLLDYYTHELLYMRALALEFAEQHPKIAASLGLQAGEIGDPYVERLVQASSFVNARTQMRTLFCQYAVQAYPMPTTSRASLTWRC